MVKHWYAVLGMLIYMFASYGMQQPTAETLCKMVIHLDLKTYRLADYQPMNIEQLHECFDTLKAAGKKIGMQIHGKNTDFKTYLLLRLKAARFAVDNIDPELPVGLIGKLMIPKSINIQTVDLSNNELTQLPEELLEFKQLKRLLMSRNKIAKFPDELVFMKSLEEADFSYNLIETVQDKAEWIGRDPQLTRFNISHNKLTVTEQEKLRTEWNKNIKKKKEDLILDQAKENKMSTTIENSCGDPV
ncbi:MAG: Leucine Rich repeats (2 copies) [Candidatus Dependentiae bacterium ADurb.Bin331]|nr:MAG: Leucine Rich repeats (2 copies) [Candidatus Dependentiae bacterium ADurb.Bin331]